MESRKSKKKLQRTTTPKVSDMQFKTLNENCNSQPRILLKVKQKDDNSSNTETSVTIATKASHSKQDPQQQRDQLKPKHSHASLQTTADNMIKSINLISTNNTLNVHALDYLQEANSDFIVIGTIGMQGAGKSTILNLLAAGACRKDMALSSNGLEVFSVNSIFTQKDSNGFEDVFHCILPEIRMHITKDRVILLDSAPVLSNRGQKDFVVSELEDIRKIIMLLNVCHIVMVLQEEYFNINFIRLILCAEMMIQLDHKNNLTPKLLFVKNKCDRKKITTQEIDLHEMYYKHLFKGSRIHIYNNICESQRVNIIHFPKLDNDDIYVLASVQKLRRWVFLTPTHDAVENPETLTEKSWFQIVTKVMESYNNNYFLRKYENLKEKYNLHNHVNVVENAAKDKNYLNFVDT
ncbi:nonsense-mediated mRNA decay factor SMG9 isoform X1 [Topomyia yanbarensis]|nr:nonsense-mediated mRNA decay factor SMG9 isoform X1 [Topomyia yanbarensis]